MGNVYFKDICYEINGAVFEVFRELGAGFLESVYEKALLVELRSRGIEASAQVPIQVNYKDEIVGQYYADIIVENKIILELKAVDKIQKVHAAQLLNYLNATKYKVGLLVNFSYPKAEVKRYVL